MRQFCIEDEKFEIIANELKRRGWESVNSDSHPALTWTNLVLGLTFLTMAFRYVIARHPYIRGVFNVGES